jgi:hypothetical protein
MRIYHSLLAGAAGTLGGFAATLIVHGGWQPVAAAVSIFGGILFLLSFIALGWRPTRRGPIAPSGATVASHGSLIFAAVRSWRKSHPDSRNGTANAHPLHRVRRCPDRTLMSHRPQGTT